MKAGLAAFAVAGLLMVGLPVLLMTGGDNKPKDSELDRTITLTNGNADSRYANAGYFAAIITLPTYTQRLRETQRYYALLERQNRGGQTFDPKLAKVLAIEDAGERVAAYARWNVEPKPTFYRP